MRPHLLTFSGIGPFPGDVEINFDDLSSKGLYLIVGRTGAGKTTIFDAMTYALYGKVAADRENAIVSAHSGAKTPVIEFTFSHGPHRYVAHREPSPPGRQNVTNKQWLSIQSLDGTEIRRLSGITTVNSEVKSILGLDDEKFMQVILLPQGKFQEFLLATTRVKKEMLQAIFGTHTYSRIVRRLEDQSKALNEDVRAESIGLVSQKTIVEGEVATLRSSAIFDDLPDPDDDLDGLIDMVGRTASVLSDDMARANDDFVAVVRERDRAQTEAERFDRATELEALRAAHQAAAPEVQTAAVKLEEHSRAESVAKAVAARNTAAENVRSLRDATSSTRGAIADVASTFPVARDVTSPFVSAIASASPMTLVGELAALRAVVDSALEKHIELDGISRDIETAAGARATFLAEVDGLSESLQTCEPNAKATEDALSAARQATRDLPEAARAAGDLNALLQAADVEGATARLVTASSALTDARKQFDEAEGVVREAERQRTHELAGELASSLNPGDACPVCGSTDHPKKATTSSSSLDLAAAAARRDQALVTMTEAERQVSDAQTAVEAARAERNRLPSPEEQQDIIARHQSLVTLSAQESALEADLKKATDEISSLKERIAAARAQITATGATITNLASRQDTLQPAVDAVGTRTDTESARALAVRIEDLLRSLEEASDDLGRAEGRLKETTEQVSSALETSGFRSEDDAVARVLDVADVKVLQELVETARQREIRIGNLTAAVGTEPLPAQRPDVAALTERVEDAKSAAESASSRYGTVDAALTRMREAREKMRTLGESLEVLTARASTAESVATVFARGGGELLDLETWVLRTLFEEVCLVANGQMRTLSNNRYTLTLEQEDGGVRRRRGGGLDIYVLDAQTGLTRPVNSMSGGEKFMASLALALGLAEVVQRHAGGIDLPCLFIDEGFGTLDHDSLDLAIDVLLQLQAAGRTVGIITHVDTMQQQLPIGIRVHKTDHGSTLEVLAD